jgi:hypothetical protein
MHKPSGLGIYGMYQHESSAGRVTNTQNTGPLTFSSPETDAWYLKPFWRKAWSPLGATVLYGEYGQYNDQFAGGMGDLCGAFAGLGGTNVNSFCTTISGNITNFTVPTGVFVNGSEVERWGLGVDQEIDSAAMHLFARWQHQEVNLSLIGFGQNIQGLGLVESVTSQKVKQSFDSWDLFQVGGVIFF